MFWVSRGEYVLRSIELDGELPHDLAVFLIIGGDQRVEVRWREQQRFEAAGDVELLSEIRPRDDFLHLGAQHGQDRLGRAGGAEYAKPDVDRDAGIELAHRRNTSS